MNCYCKPNDKALILNLCPSAKTKLRNILLYEVPFNPKSVLQSEDPAEVIESQHSSKFTVFKIFLAIISERKGQHSEKRKVQSHYLRILKKIKCR